MGGKKLKTSNGGGLSKPLGLNKSKKNKEGYSQNISTIVESDEKLPKKKEEKKKKKSSEKRRNSLEGVAIVEKKKSKLKNKKRQREKIIDAEIDEPSNETGNTEEKNEMEGEVDEKIIITKKEKKKKRKNEKIGEVNEVNNEVQQRKGKSKKARNTEKKDQILSNNDEEEKVGAEEDEVYEISSGDEDLTAGMTKWVSEYHESRPGLDILQQRIDDFITDHEAKEEQARKEKEARMAEDGWTFVGAQKGRKKTADSDGVVVGSVAEAAVRDKFSKKQTKLVGPDFYRFQKREAHRNEIMKLQSKFEEDKKRIQQMRATRKFRPY